MSKEAMKLALEALKQIDEAMPFPVAKLAQAALREALAEQPAQRTWVGLTNQERENVIDNSLTPACVVLATEAKLKEKNNGN